MIRMVVLPGEGKYNHLALMRHRGGGWWDVECMGEGKRCKTGACKHTAGLGLKGRSGNVRPVRQVARAAWRGDEPASNEVAGLGTGAGDPWGGSTVRQGTRGPHASAQPCDDSYPMNAVTRG